MASLIFNRAKKEIFDGTLDMSATGDIRLLLVTSAYTPNADHDFIDLGGSDAVTAELSGTGYVRKALASEAFAEDDANDRAEWDADDVVFTGITAGTAAAFVIYDHTGVDTTSVIIAYVDTGGFPIVTNGGDLTITFNAEGIIQLT